MRAGKQLVELGSGLQRAPHQTDQEVDSSGGYFPPGIESLVPTYLANVRRGMDEILAGGDSKDWETARRLGHQLKGTGESYGFPEITRTGAAVELAAKAGHEDEIRSQTLALSSYLERLKIAEVEIAL